MLGQEQFLFTGNIGMDYSYTDGVRYTAGAYLSGYLFKLAAPDYQLFSLSGQLRTDLARLDDRLPDRVENSFTSEYNYELANGEQWAFGIGPRVRLQIDKQINRLVRLGIESSFGYHHMVSGTDVLAETRTRTASRIITQNAIPKVLADQIKQELGADETSDAALNGINYTASFFLLLEL